MSDNIFTCSGCKARFKVTKAPSSGKIKCPKCGVVAPFKPASLATQDTQIAPPAAKAAGPATPPPPLPLGAVVSGHKIIQFVGSSAQTASYKAAQTSMGRNVLFRVLQPAYANDTAMREAFFAEARSAAKLNHPNIISVFDMGQEGSTCFYTMEFMEGGTLTTYLAKNEKLTSAQRLSIATQIAQAFACAEAAGIRASSVEPDHVLLTDRGDVRISHMGGGVVGGGAPKPAAYVLRRLLFLVLASKDLPAQARMPGVAANSIQMPLAHDTIGSQMNTIVEKLIKNPDATIAETASEFDKLLENNQRRSTVREATTAAPKRLSAARQAESNKVIWIGAIAAGVLIVLGVVYLLLSNQKLKEAETIFETAQKQFKDGLVFDSIDNYQILVEKYGGTDPGKGAAAEIDKVKLAAIKQEFAKVRKEFEATPEKLTAMKAGVVAKSEWLQTHDRLKNVPGIMDLIKQEEKKALESVEIVYFNGCVMEWKNNQSHDQITKLCQSMKYGEALKMIQEAANKWAETEGSRNYFAKYSQMVSDNAKKKYTELMNGVETMIKDKKYPQAEAQLKLIEDFGLPEYNQKVKMKREEINKLKGT